MNNLVKKIKESDLLENEKHELFSAFRMLDAESSSILGDLVNKDPLWLKRFSENLKVKKRVLKSGNLDEWNKIIEDEVSQLEKLEARN